MVLLSIGELAKRAGVQASAIRYYESLGLISAPERFGGKRRYGEETLARLEAIHLFKRAGFSMAELQVLFQSDPLPDQAVLSHLVDRKLTELDDLIYKIQVMKQLLLAVRRCGCLTVEECALLLTRDA